MKRNLTFLIFLFLFGFVSSELYYSVDLEYDNSVVVDSVDLVYLRVGKNNVFFEDGPRYGVSLLDDLGSVVYSESISVPNKMVWDSFGENGSGENLVDNVSFKVYLPYFENANFIVINSIDGKLVYEEDVRVYAKVRGEFRESGDKGGQVGLEVKSNVRTKESGGENYWFLLIGIVILVVLIIVILVL